METAYLLRSPANAERLLRSIADAEAGRTETQELIDSRARRRVKISFTREGWEDYTSWANEQINCSSGSTA